MTDITLLPCPFCGSNNVDPRGWASTDRSGPACDDCSGSADTVELWNKRPEVERMRQYLGFFASVIKSGDPWTTACQRELDAALGRDTKVVTLPVVRVERY